MLASIGYIVLAIMVWGAIAGFISVIALIGAGIGIVLLIVFVIALICYWIYEWWTGT